MFQYADYIYAVYKEKSFSAAAKKMYISQPSLSAAVKRAEEKLGFLIFDRSSSPPVLTDAGHVYIAAVEEMNKVKRNLKNYVQNIHSLTYGDVVVSGNSFISAFFLPPILAKFSNKYPSIRLFSEEGHEVQLHDKLLNEETDVLVDNELDVNEFVALPLVQERILLAVPKTDALYKQYAQQALTRNDITSGKPIIPISLSKHDGDTLIHLERGPMRGQSSRLCAEYSLSFQKIVTVDQLLTAVGLVNAGVGITFVTDTLVKLAPSYTNIAYFALDTPLAEQTLYIAHKKKAYLSPAVAEFIRFSRELYGHK